MSDVLTACHHHLFCLWLSYLDNIIIYLINMKIVVLSLRATPKKGIFFLNFAWIWQLAMQICGQDALIFWETLSLCIFPNPYEHWFLFILISIQFPPHTRTTLMITSKYISLKFKWARPQRVLRCWRNKKTLSSKSQRAHK